MQVTVKKMEVCSNIGTEHVPCWNPDEESRRARNDLKEKHLRQTRPFSRCTKENDLALLNNRACAANGALSLKDGSASKRVCRATLATHVYKPRD